VKANLATSQNLEGKKKSNHHSGTKDNVTSTKFMVATTSCFHVCDFEKFVKVVAMWHPWPKLE
jgi:hypothetical protein